MMTPTDVLGPAGPMERLLPGYAPRPQQVEMAEVIAASLAGGESLICEAGTGTGKTFAYLVPAVLSGRKTIVSTGTRHLQDQLFARDLPMVREAVGTPVNIALLKGRSNYLCKQRLQMADASTGRKTGGSLERIRLWGAQTRTGDLAEMPDLPEESPLRPAITSSAENCLGQSCDYFDDCFVFQARRRAMDADVTVVNHHLYLSDLALRERGFGELLPEAELTIFDEAHQLAQLASEFFSRIVTANQWFDLLRDCREAYHKEAGDVPDFPPCVDRVEKAVRDLRLAFGSADLSVEWRETQARADVAAALVELLERAHDLHQGLDALAGRGKLLGQCARRLDDLLELTASFHEAAADSTHVQWLELRGRGFALHRTPLDISGEFQEKLAASGSQYVFTSATLSVGGDFSLFTGQLGLAGMTARRWPSPFDFQRNAILYVPEGLPDPRENGYTELVVDKAREMLAITGGRAFLLFTSYRALNIAARLIRDQVSCPVFVQGDAPRTELLDAFRRAGDAVLMGTGSFWEGVDVRGQALVCVVIDKLPFAPPDDPVMRARMRALEEAQRNPFREYQLPTAVIDLLQGIGRLIRDQDDYGVLMVCDPRLVGKSYGRVFLRSLPDMELTRSAARVAEFLATHEGLPGK